MMREWMTLVVAVKRYGYSDAEPEISIPVNLEEGD